jgi:proline racemase/trans-L-3-hydroxyproline dehydratase
MASMYAKGQLSLHKEFVHQSIIRTAFSGTLKGEEPVGNLRGVIPEITGRAFITGIQHFIVDPDDPLRDGFLLC